VCFEIGNFEAFSKGTSVCFIARCETMFDWHVPAVISISNHFFFAQMERNCRPCLASILDGRNFLQVGREMIM